MTDIYREHILDHYKNPRGWGKIKDADKVVREANASCGDVFKFYIKVGKKGQITSVKFEGEGCAISTAACSVVVEEVRNKKLDVDYIRNLTIKDVERLLGLKADSTRNKCVQLPLKALKRIIDEKSL